METANWQVLLLMVVFSGLVLWKIAAARRNPHGLFIRRIPGLNAIDDAVGRATELGAPVLFHAGIADFTNPQTLAALGILEHVSKVCAKFSTRMIITTGLPVMVPICEGVLKSAFETAGRPEMMDRCEVRFVSPANDLTALGTAKAMVDDKVASAFLFGSYDYTSLLYSEGGQIAGCVQIAGTADYYQIPFFIASCDYVVIVEELFASSSYLSREPVMLGTVVGQDYGKLVLLALIVAGIVSVTVFGDGNPLNLIERWMTF